MWRRLRSSVYCVWPHWTRCWTGRMNLRNGWMKMTTSRWDSLRPNDIIWQYRAGLNQCWPHYFGRFSGIHLRAISQRVSNQATLLYTVYSWYIYIIYISIGYIPELEISWSYVGHHFYPQPPSATAGIVFSHCIRPSVCPFRMTLPL